MAITFYEHALEEVYGICLDFGKASEAVGRIRTAANKKAKVAMIRSLYNGNVAVLKRDVAALSLMDKWGYFDFKQDMRLKLLRLIWQVFRVSFGGNYKEAFRTLMEQGNIWILEDDYIDEAVASVCDLSNDPDAQILNNLYGRKPIDERKLDVFLRRRRTEAVRDTARDIVNMVYRFSRVSIEEDMEGVDIADWKDCIKPTSEERQALLQVIWWVCGFEFDHDIMKLVSAVAGDEG